MALPNSSCGFRPLLFFFFSTEGVKNLPINIQDERKKKIWETFYPSPYAQECKPYYGIDGHTQSDMRVLGEPESISTVRDEESKHKCTFLE